MSRTERRDERRARRDRRRDREDGNLVPIGDMTDDDVLPGSMGVEGVSFISRRARTEIEAEAKDLPRDARLTVEVLLDIRDLLGG